MLSQVVHFRIREGMVAVAAVALVCTWPGLLLLLPLALLIYVAYAFSWTLIELLVVVSILGVLSGLFIPAVQSNCRRSVRPLVSSPSVPEDDEEFWFYFGDE